ARYLYAPPAALDKAAPKIVVLQALKNVVVSPDAAPCCLGDKRHRIDVVALQKPNGIEGPYPQQVVTRAELPDDGIGESRIRCLHRRQAGGGAARQQPIISVQRQYKGSVRRAKSHIAGRP